MTGKKPHISLDAELGADQSLAMLAPHFGDFADAIEHQHRRQRQLGIALAEQLAPAACEQILILIAAAPSLHSGWFLELGPGRSRNTRAGRGAKSRSSKTDASRRRSQRLAATGENPYDILRAAIAGVVADAVAPR